MKLLFDQNLSASLVELLRTEFPDSSHLRLLNLADAADSTVWDYAAREGFIIVSKDVDFQQRALLYGGPPKVVWVRLGNCSTAQVAALLRARFHEITLFAADPTAAFLALS